MRMAVDLNLTRLVKFWKQWVYSEHRPFIVSLMKSLKAMGFDTIMCPAWAAWPIYVNAARDAEMAIIPMLPNVTCVGKPHADPVNVRQKLALYTDMFRTDAFLTAHVPAIWYGDDLGSLNAGDCSILRSLAGMGLPTVWTPPVYRTGRDADPPLETEIVGQVHLWPQGDREGALWEGLAMWEKLRNLYPDHRRGVCIQTYGDVPTGRTLDSLLIAKALGATTAFCFCAMSDEFGGKCLFDYAKLMALEEPVVTEDCWTHMAHEVKAFAGEGAEG